MAKTKIFAALMALCLTFAGCAGGTGTETAGETFTEKPETDSETLAERLETEQEADPGFPTADLYVDYTNGDDGNDGSENSPFKTLTAARDAARKLHDESEETLYVNIWLREGVHKLSETFKLSVKDSYTSFLAYEGESPVVSGGEKIEGWTEGENGIWSAPAKGVDSRDFFVNGNRATRAKHKIKRVSKLSKDGIQVLDSTMATVSKPQYMEFVFKYVWNSSRLRAESAVTDESGKTMFTMSFRGWNIYHNTAFLGGASLTPRDVYYAENAIEFLDEPGEWYLDPDTDKIYYMPLEGEDISKAEAYLGALERLITIKGTNKGLVKSVSFKGITFSHNTWLQASRPEGLLSIQANFYKMSSMNANNTGRDLWGAPLAAIEGNYAEDIVLEGNTFKQIGSTAVHFKEGVKNSRIERNYLTDCASSGIVVGGFSDTDHSQALNNGGARITEDIKIEDNLIEEIASVYYGGVGIGAGYVNRVSISYNTLRDLPYTAISLGWGWGQSCTELKTMNKKFKFGDNRICNNYIENVMNVLFDGGGIYTLGRNDGTIISGNYIKHVNNDFGAIYLDDGSAGYTVQNNAIVECYRNFIYKGDYNHISDNFSRRARQPNYDLRAPLVPGNYTYTFENNDLWDKDKVEEIRINAGVRAQ